MRKCRHCKKEIPPVKLSDNWQRNGFCCKDCQYSYKPKPKSSTKPKAKKLKSIAKLRDEAAVVLQQMVRLKAATDAGYCECWTCRAVEPWNKMQGGHFIERGKAATKIMEENVHPQCPACNQWGMKNTTTVLAYRDAMIDMYGADFVDDMVRASKQPVKHTREWIAEQKAYFESQVTFHKKRLGIA